MSIAPVRISMWSGPRNLSTAMMRSWGNRPDTYVCDEPLYAYFLKATGKPHPGAAEVMAHQECDWRKVVDWLMGPVPGGKQVFFAKQMTHHLLSEIDRSWLADSRHFFLIRHPREVITSYLAKHDPPALEDLGYVQQGEIFDFVRKQQGQPAPVIDASDVQNNPRGVLAKLCERLQVPFTDDMLSWPPGFRPTDGIWARHWYPEVETSTGFRPHQVKPGNVPDELMGVYQRCMEVYEPLHEQRIV